MRALPRTSSCRRAAPGRGSTRRISSRSSIGACSSIICSGRRACSRCRKPCSVKSPTIVQAESIGARETNEDRLGHWSTPEAVLMAVADGLGGHLHGEMAAQIAIDILGAAFQGEARPQLAEPSQFLVRALGTAHSAILREARKLDLPETPRTVVAA